MNGNDVLEHIENNTERLYKEFAESRPKEFVDFLLKKWTNTGDLWFYLDWFVQRNDQEFNTFAAQDLAETEQAQAEYLRG
jgi:hypothetical protein